MNTLDTQKNFWITAENLENSQRKVPIHAIVWTLTGEQKNYAQWDFISAKYLTPEQLQIVEEALAFDVAATQITWETSQKAYLCL